MANTVNIAADLGGMAGVTAMLLGTDSIFTEPAYAALILGVLIFGSYRTIVRIFKWLTLVLFAYVIAASWRIRIGWRCLRATLVPQLEFARPFLMTLVAIFGTTISPYLFFWQAAQAVEVERVGGQGRRRARAWARRRASSARRARTW